MSKFLIFTMIMQFVSCASLSSGGQKVQLLWDQGEVDECEFRGMVSSYSMWGGIAAQSVGEEQAKTKVRNEAAEMGATHVVLGQASGGYFGGKANGRAYFCEE